MNTESFPTFRAWGRFLRRCLRRLHLLFLSRKSLVVYFTVFTLLTLAWIIDRWHGRNAWAVEKERLAAAGETLDPGRIFPGRPPDAENFWAIPELRSLRVSSEPPPLRAADGSAVSGAYWTAPVMWYAQDSVEKETRQGRVFRAKIQLPHPSADTPLSKYCDTFRKTGALPAEPLSPGAAEELMLSAAPFDGVLSAIEAASYRPAAVLLPAPAERNERVWSLSPAWAPRRGLTLHGLAALETGQKTAALRDLRILHRLADALRNERSLMGLLVAEVMVQGGQEIIRAGIRRHQWSAEELNSFLSSHAENTLEEAWYAAMQGERAILCQTLEHPGEMPPFVGWSKETEWATKVLRTAQHFYWKCAPEGPGLRYCAAISRFYSDLGTEFRNPSSGETWLERLARVDRRGYPAIFDPNFVEGTPRCYVRPLYSRRLLRAACLLELHYLTAKRYPATLDGITAGALETFTDMDGKLLRYRTDSEGTAFRIWTVGLDGRDDSENPKTMNRDELVFSTEPPREK